MFDLELALIPTSLFRVTGEPHFTLSKATLNKKIKVEMLSCEIANNAILVDGGGMFLSFIPYPKKGLVEDIVRGYEQYITWICLLR